jgi:hypothetical protein
MPIPELPPSDVHLETRCLNCGTTFTGNFCPSCGQAASEKLHVPLRIFLRESVLDFFVLDSRLLRTLKIFLLKPGALTLAHIAGKRAPYIPPFRFYLFTTFVMLVLFGFVSGWSKSERERDAKGVVQVNMGNKKSDASDAKGILQINVTPDSSDYADGNFFSHADSVAAGVVVDTAWVESGEFDLKHQLKAGMIHATQNPLAFAAELLRRFLQTLFALMPLYAVVLYLLYRRSGYAFIDHLIFSLHGHTFMFMLVMTVAIMRGIGRAIHADWLQSAVQIFLLAIPVYLFLAMKQVYQQSVLKTTIKFVMLHGIHFVLVLAALTAALFAAFLFR